MSTATATDLREEVCRRYAESALAITSGETGLGDVSVTFTHEVADGMHGAIVKATKPARTA